MHRPMKVKTLFKVACYSFIAGHTDDAYFSMDFKLESASVNFLIPNIKTQILFVIPACFLFQKWGEVVKISREFILSDHIPNSHDLSGR